MTDGECVVFLQWALPRLGLRWPGFRRVRGQVRKRLARRLGALGLADLGAYRARLEAGAAEWRALDAMCRIAISRFWRDRSVWQRLAGEVLPWLARDALARGAPLACWSAGCASGEEPYTLALVADRLLGPALPGLRLRVLATDVDEAVLERARRACYGASSVRELPAGWVDACFTREPVGEPDGELCLVPRLRDLVELRCADLRRELPAETFDLVLCRNLVFTYFDEAGQRAALSRLLGCLRPGGVLAIGRKERLPPGGAPEPGASGPRGAGAEAPEGPPPISVRPASGSRRTHPTGGGAPERDRRRADAESLEGRPIVTAKTASAEGLVPLGEGLFRLVAPADQP